LFVSAFFLIRYVKQIATPSLNEFTRKQAFQTTDPPIAYNIAHDNGLVVMAFGPGLKKPPAFSIGVDVMKVKVPGSEKTIDSLIEMVGDQVHLTSRSNRLTNLTIQANRERTHVTTGIKNRRRAVRALLLVLDHEGGIYESGRFRFRLRFQKNRLQSPKKGCAGRRNSTSRLGVPHVHRARWRRPVSRCRCGISW